MKKPFEWHHSLLYADKSRDEYTMKEEGTLDHLLYQMYMLAHDYDGLKMSSALKALNTAYYLAVAIYNTPHVEESNNVGNLTYGRVREILSEEHAGVSEADIFLVRWMAWAILKLQSSKPVGLDAFLDKFKKLIAWDEDRCCPDRDSYGYIFDERRIKYVNEQKKKCSFIDCISDMVEEMVDVKFDTDLQPNAILPFTISDEIWKNDIKNLEFEEMQQLLRHYRTIENQLMLLDFSEGNDNLYKEGVII